MSSFEPTPFDPLAELRKLNHVVRTLPRAPWEGGPRWAGRPEEGRGGGLLWAAMAEMAGQSVAGPLPTDGGPGGARGEMLAAAGGSGPTAELCGKGWPWPATFATPRDGAQTERMGGRWEHADVCTRVLPWPPNSTRLGPGAAVLTKGKGDKRAW